MLLKNILLLTPESFLIFTKLPVLTDIFSMFSLEYETILTWVFPLLKESELSTDLS